MQPILEIAKSPRSQVFIGISGGHVHSRVVIVPLDSGPPVQIPNGPPLIRHYAQDPTTWISRLSELSEVIAPHMASCGGATIVLRVSLPGAAQKNEQSSTKTFLARLFVNADSIEVIDDTWAIAMPYRFKGPVVSIIAGMGASVSLIHNYDDLDRNLKVDGVGPIVGDFGSAFELSTMYFRSLGRKNNRHIECPLFPLIKDFASRFEIKFEEPAQLQTWLNGMIRHDSDNWRPNFAQCALPVLHAADLAVPSRQRSYARKLVRRSVHNLCGSIDIAMQAADTSRLLGDATFSVICHGDMFANCDFFKASILSHLQNEWSVKAAVIGHDDADGALLYRTNQEDFKAIVDILHMQVVA